MKTTLGFVSASTSEGGSGIALEFVHVTDFDREIIALTEHRGVRAFDANLYFAQGL